MKNTTMKNMTTNKVKNVEIKSPVASMPEEAAQAPKAHRLTAEEKAIKATVMDTLKGRIACHNDGMRATYHSSDHSFNLLVRNGVRCENDEIASNATEERDPQAAACENDEIASNATEERDPQAAACENDEIASNLVLNYIKTLHQRSNDARYMSICEKVNEAKRALIEERDELESKCNAYDIYVSLCCERGGSYDAFYSFSDSLYDSIRNEMLKHVNDDDEYDSVYDSIRELSDSDVVAMYIELFEADEAEAFRRLDSARHELRDAVVNEVEYMTDYDENETLHELRNALAEDE